MKAYKLEVLVIDYDEDFENSQEVIDILENQKYPNWCMSPNVKRIEVSDIGEWHDDHPLNSGDTCKDYYNNMKWNNEVIKCK